MRIFYLLILFSNLVHSQQNWNETYVPYLGARYDDVFFLNENLGWAANGYYSKVYKTTNGGADWILQFEDENNYFRNIEFLNENIGFLGTLNGSFFKTIDGGTNWNVVQLPNNTESICGLDAVGTSTIYGCGAYFEPAYFIKSTDSGLTWTTKDMSQYATGLVEVLFTSENVGYASGKSADGGVILKTIDGGENWTNIYTSPLAGEYVWKLQILESNTNVMFGSVQSVVPFTGKLIKSTNLGQTWVSNDVPDVLVQAVGFVSETHGWMGGHNSGFLETFDSGLTWTNTGFGDQLNRLIFMNNIAYACGLGIYKYSSNLSTDQFKKETDLKPVIKINPNPVVDKLNIEIEYLFADNLLLELYSSDGKFISKLERDKIDAKSKQTYTIDFPYPNGTYILNFHTNSERQSVKIIK